MGARDTLVGFNVDTLKPGLIPRSCEIFDQHLPLPPILYPSCLRFPVNSTGASIATMQAATAGTTTAATFLPTTAGVSRLLTRQSVQSLRRHDC